jgi:hypothetical protein
VLVSFMLVNASLLWLARGRRAAAPARSLADVVVPGLALVLCALLLLHVGWPAVAVAVALALVGLALGRR